VDLLTRLPLSEARTRLREAGLATDLLRGDPLEGGFPCLKGTCDGIPFDVLPQLVPIHWELAPRVEDPAAGELRAVPLEDLLALKMKAQGPKDLMDAAMLVLLHPEAEVRARDHATAYGVLDRFETWLADPRMRAQAREEAVAPVSRRQLTSTRRRRKPAKVARRRRPGRAGGRLR
jgi:hypothetical protein